MTTAAAGLVAYLAAFVMLGGTAVTLQHRFRIRELVASLDRNAGDEHPQGRAEYDLRLSALPGLTRDVIQTLNEPAADPAHEGLRRAVQSLIAATAIWMFVGAPIAMVVAAVARLVSAPLGPLPGAILAVGGLAWLLRDLRRFDPGLLDVIPPAVAVTVGLALALTSLTPST